MMSWKIFQVIICKGEETRDLGFRFNHFSMRSNSDSAYKAYQILENLAQDV